MVNKKLLISGINQDDSYNLVDTKEYLNALNIRYATSENGKVGQLSNIEGNVIKNATIGGTFTLPAGTNITIGAYEDLQNRRSFFFNYNSNGNHGLYTYDADTDLVYTVLLSSKVVGGLNFSLDNLIHSCAYVNGLLYWTDNRNWQRRINVDAGIKLNHPTYVTSVAPYVLDKNSSGGSGSTHMSSSVINLIRNQPRFPLTVNKVVDSTYINNLVKDGSFQFAYRFVYRDNEVSTFSPLSSLVNFNLASDTTKNAIDVTIPLSQKIDQDVKYIEVGVKFMIDGNMFIIRTFESGFSNHNSGTAITFKFYNDVVGIAVDNASATKPFDSVPLYSKTLETAKNRLFLGNNTDGYSTPTKTSLSISSIITNPSTLNGQWYIMGFTDAGFNWAYRYFLYVPDSSTNPGYYTPSSQPSTPLPTSGVVWSNLTYKATINDVINTLKPSINHTYRYNESTGIVTTFTGAPSPAAVDGTRAFKSDATYSAGVVFFDESGRKCGVVTNSNIKLTTADRAYTLGNYTSGISWALNNSDDPTGQIPIWATHYSVVRTKCLRTSFFVQIRTNEVTYAVRNATTGVISFNNSYDPAHYGIALKVSGLFNNGLGYTYQEGDILKLYISGGSTYSLKVKESYGEYIIVDLENIGGTASINSLIEVYSQYFQSDNEPYYEVGDTYLINDAGKNTRNFSVTNGVFGGDVYILNQKNIPSGTYPCEVMSPTNKFWKYWFTDIGRPSIVVKSGQTVKPVSIYYSNVIVPGTQTNGLSSFEVLSQTSVPTELNQINRLILTSKVQSEGTVMLALGEQETASIYIGESQIFDNTGNSFLATTSGVIGNINILRGNFGTINPESSFKWEGDVIYFDANKGAWIKYSVNGLFPISSNKMQKYFRKVGQDIIANIKDQTEYNYANPYFPVRVLGGIDPYHGEYLCYVPKMYLNPKNEILTDMELGSSSVNFTTIATSMSVTPSTMTFTYVQGSGPSASQSAVFTGTSITLNGNVTVTGSANFEVSSNNSAFSSSITFPYTGINKSATFYVRMKAGLSGGSYNGQIVTISDGTTSAQISVSGTVSVPIVPVIFVTPSVLGGFSYVSGSGPSASQSFVVTAANLTPSSGNITVTPPTDYEISTTSGTSGFGSSPLTIAYTSGGTITSGTVWVRLKAGLSESSYNGQNIVVSGGGATSVNVTCSGQVTSSGGATVYGYPTSGYGNSVSSACNMASGFPVDLYSTSDSGVFGVGSVVYTNSAGTTLLTGYSYVFINSAVWTINSANGTITSYSSTQC